MNSLKNPNQNNNDTDPKIPIEGYSFKWWNQIKFTQIFTALKYPNYRLWFWGQLISLFGSWMQTTALGFLIFELTHSPAYLGLLGFSFGIPTWIFMLYGGVIADRISKRTLLVITQSAMMFFALILALLTFLGVIQPWQIIIIAFILGIANAFDAPARQAFVLEMVDRESLTNAIALNSTMFNSATALGPAAGGIVYAVFGPAWCFTINSISFLAVILSLSRMKLEPFVRSSGKNSTVKDLVEGMKFVIHHKIIRTIILMVVMTTIFGISYVTLLPAWAVKVLHGDATTNGLLQSARGVGALLGALFIASLGKFKFKGMLLTIGSFTFPLFVIVFSFMGSVYYSLLSLIGVGMSMMFIFNMANSMIQLLVPDALRGRIMGIYSLSFFGLMPVGALLVGISAEHISEPLTVFIDAVILILFSAVVWFFVPKIKNQE